MRFEQLDLLAFGPFTDERLDLRGGAPGGLHVIYGPNEAGKSTSLRAVTNFLFGIPRRSIDAHLHPLPKLSIGATLSDQGEVYELIRLKRNRDDLVDRAGRVVPGTLLSRLLGHLDETSFSLRFGLDQVELEKGAEALLGGSEQGLFAAGTAGSDVRRVLSDLESDASALFLPRGKLPLLNRQNAEYEKSLSEVRRGERPVEKWMSQKAAHEAALQRVSAIQSERSEVRAELRRLNRLKAVLSDLSEWQKASRRLEELRNVVELPADSFERRLRISAEITEYKAEARRIFEDLAGFEEELNSLPEVSPICDIDDEQLNLGARIGTAISARNDLPKRRAALLEQERQISLLLRDLGRNVEQGAELHVAREALVGAEASGTVGRLIASHSGLISQLYGAEERLKKLRQRVSDREGESFRALDVSRLPRLEALLAEAKSAVELSVEAKQEIRTLSALRVKVERLRAELHCSTSWQDLAGSLPERSFFNQWNESAIDGERTMDVLTRSLNEAELRIEQCSGRFRNDGGLPNEELLRTARTTRNLIVDQVERGHLGEERWLDLRAAIEGADRIADDLLLHADAVFEARALSQELAETSEQALLLRKKIAERQELDERNWSKIIQLARQLSTAPPSRSSEVLMWSEKLRSLIELEEDATTRAAQVEPLAQQIQETMRSVAEELQENLHKVKLPGLISLLEREVRSVLQGRERLQLWEQDKKRLEREQEEALSDLDAARASLAEWKEAWHRAVLPLGLDGSCSIERAQEVLSTLQRIERVVEVAANYESRINGMLRDTEALERDIGQYVRQYLPSLPAHFDTVDRAVRLIETIRAARHHRDDRIRVRALIEERRATLSVVEAKLASATEKVSAMMRLAGAQNEVELAEGERLSNEKRELSARAFELFERIRVSSDGASIDELLAEAAQWDGAVRRLIVRIDDLDQRTSDLEEELREAEADAEGKRLGLLAYQTEDVAVSRQVLSERGAAARASLRKYLVTRAAHALLNEQVARYAERFSGPIARRASEMFSRITLQKYSRLSIGLGERSLRCVRDGHEIDVSELSRGARAQLYFVLRLASLERYFEEHSPVPLVFDDLFVDFDDDRTTAAFELLAELAPRVQILYFTHLARDVEKAHDAVAGDLLFSHTIGVG